MVSANNPRRHTVLKLELRMPWDKPAFRRPSLRFLWRLHHWVVRQEPEAPEVPRAAYAALLKKVMHSHRRKAKEPRCLLNRDHRRLTRSRFSYCTPPTGLKSHVRYTDVYLLQAAFSAGASQPYMTYTDANYFCGIGTGPWPSPRAPPVGWSVVSERNAVPIGSCTGTSH